MQGSIGVQTQVGHQGFSADHAIGDQEGRQKPFGILLAQALCVLADDHDDFDLGIARILWATDAAQHGGADFQLMNMAAQQARNDGEDLVEQPGECLPVVPGEGTIHLVRVVVGGSTDSAKDGASSHPLLLRG